MELYRYHDSLSEHSDPWLTTYQVVSSTPKGCWIQEGGGNGRFKVGDRRWIGIGVKNQRAWPTKLEAMQHYILRKNRQEGLIKGNLELCQRRRYAAENMLGRLEKGVEK